MAVKTGKGDKYYLTSTKNTEGGYFLLSTTPQPEKWDISYRYDPLFLLWQLEG
jgi:hypothetical protein